MSKLYEKVENVLYGRFGKHDYINSPDWMKKAVERHSGLHMAQLPNGSFYLDGTDVTLPDGKTIDAGAGYIRLTGQWRQNLEDGDYEVECFCCKTGLTRWINAFAMQPPRLIDDLTDFVDASQELG